MSGHEHGAERQTGHVEPAEKTPAPERKPSGELGGQPVNADETAPREVMPEPGGESGPDRHPEAVEDEPGQDL